MMRAKQIFLVLLLMRAGTAAAAPCGSVTFEGECMGTLLRYCSDAELVEVDCVAEYTANTVCMELDPTYGFGCAVAVGEDCYYTDVDDEIIVAACQGTDPACLEDATTALCVENLGPCTEADVDTCTPQGGLIMLCTEFKQPNILDCVALGGVCASGQCGQIPEGGYCDDIYSFCATGLVCRDSACASESIMPPTNSDAGVADRSVPDVMGPVRPDLGFGFPSEDASVMSSQSLPKNDQAKTSCSCDAIRSQAAEPKSLSWVLLGCLLLLGLSRSGARFRE
jgi:hypothetical protein